MGKEFLPYELALELKKLGFDMKCFGRYFFRTDIHKIGEEELELCGQGVSKFELPEYTILVPLYQQAFEWFREKGYYNYITSHLESWGNDGELVESYGYRIFYKKCDYKCEVEEVLKRFDTYEEARLECLKKLIEIV